MPTTDSFEDFLKKLARDKGIIVANESETDAVEDPIIVIEEPVKGPKLSCRDVHPSVELLLETLGAPDDEIWSKNLTEIEDQARGCLMTDLESRFMRESFPAAMAQYGEEIISMCMVYGTLLLIVARNISHDTLKRVGPAEDDDDDL